MKGPWQIEIIQDSSPIEVEFKSGVEYRLPIASPNVLGGVRPQEKTDEMTQPVGVDENGALWTKESSSDFCVQADWEQTDTSSKSYILNKPIIYTQEETDLKIVEKFQSEIATDSEIIDMLIQEDMIIAMSDSDGSILTDEYGDILTW